MGVVEHKLVNLFFQRYKDFKKYEGITSERKRNLIKAAEDFVKIYGNISKEEQISYFFGIMRNGKNINLYTYDDVCFMFILIFDPECKLFDYYLFLRIPSPAAIKKATAPSLVRSLNNDRTRKLNYLKDSCRFKLCFYDPFIITMEKYYYSKFLLNSEMEISFKPEAFKNIIENLDLEIDFSSFSLEDFNRLKSVLDNWMKSFEFPNIRLLLANHLTKYPHYFKVSTLEEKYILLIMAIDPELIMLQTFYESSRWDDVKEICTNKFGFFSKDFIKLEEKYNEHFIKKDVDPWNQKNLHLT